MTSAETTAHPAMASAESAMASAESAVTSAESTVAAAHPTVLPTFASAESTVLPTFTLTVLPTFAPTVLPTFASAEAATFTKSPSETSETSEPTEHENRRRKHRAIERVQRRNFLLLRFGRVLSGVAILPDDHLIALVLFLMALKNAYAHFGIVVPVHGSRAHRITAEFIRRKICREPNLLRGIYPDRRKARVGEHRFCLFDSLGLRGFVVLVCPAARNDERRKKREEKSYPQQEIRLSTEIITPAPARQNDKSAGASIFAR
jgi:hypothetical protein